MKIKQFEEIQAWQLARELTKKGYNVALDEAYISANGFKETYELAGRIPLRRDCYKRFRQLSQKI